MEIWLDLLPLPGFSTAHPASRPKISPESAHIALRDKIEAAVSLEVGRRLTQIGQPPLLAHNPPYQYDPSAALITRPSLNAPASSSRNPMADYYTAHDAYNLHALRRSGKKKMATKKATKTTVRQRRISQLLFRIGLYRPTASGATSIYAMTRRPPIAPYPMRLISKNDDTSQNVITHVSSDPEPMGKKIASPNCTPSRAAPSAHPPKGGYMFCAV